MSLSQEIIHGTPAGVLSLLDKGEPLDVIDIYGYTPLIEAIIANQPQIVSAILAKGADVNCPDVTGATPLFWAVDTGNMAICEALLQAGANPNLYPLSGQSVLVYPFLREQQALKALLYQYGADLEFAKAYINTKLLAHRFELEGESEIVDKDGTLVEIQIEGFFLEFTLSLIEYSLAHFKRHYVARELRDYFNAFQTIIDGLKVAGQLRRFLHFTVDAKNHNEQINALLEHDLLIIPIAYQGHAITCLHYGDYFVKCDRGEYSKNHASVVVYQVGNKDALTLEFIKDLIYGEHHYRNIHHEIETALRLMPVTTLELPAQLVGNCSWANVEAVIPASLFLFWLAHHTRTTSMDEAKNFIMGLFNRWQQWDKDVALTQYLQSYHALKKDDLARRLASVILLANLFANRLDPNFPPDVERAKKIIPVLLAKDTRSIFDIYLKQYCTPTLKPEGKRLRKLFDGADVDFPRL